MAGKYQDAQKQISQVYHQHKGRMGYHRIAIAIRKQGWQLNHKTVFKLMKAMGLKSLVRVQKYRSYKGDTGNIASNILNRDFKSNRPSQKWATESVQALLIILRLLQIEKQTDLCFHNFLRLKVEQK
ncbi:IS3 family transposase [Dyadobacter chenwenxiniae]|uniref:IS3 family transposase n=1 Tax=Dyadobacter chenwenxiniae TaxID=2906456 RepID=UPI0035B69F51